MTLAGPDPDRFDDGALRRLVDQLQEAQEIARIGSWSWDVAPDRVDWSSNLYERLFACRGRLERDAAGDGPAGRG
jgi:hypothetical protein